MIGGMGVGAFCAEGCAMLDGRPGCFGTGLLAAGERAGVARLSLSFSAGPGGACKKPRGGAGRSGSEPLRRRMFLLSGDGAFILLKSFDALCRCMSTGGGPGGSINPLFDSSAFEGGPLKQVARSWSKSNPYQGPLANITRGGGGNNPAQRAMKAQIRRKDANPTPNLTHLGAILAELHATLL